MHLFYQYCFQFHFVNNLYIYQVFLDISGLSFFVFYYFYIAHSLCLCKIVS